MTDFRFFAGQILIRIENSARHRSRHLETDLRCWIDAQQELITRLLSGDKKEKVELLVCGASCARRGTPQEDISLLQEKVRTFLEEHPGDREMTRLMSALELSHTFV